MAAAAAAAAAQAGAVASPRAGLVFAAMVVVATHGGEIDLWTQVYSVS